MLTYKRLEDPYKTPEIVALIKDWVADEWDMPFDEQHATKTVLSHFTCGCGHIYAAFDDAGQIVGFISGLTVDHPVCAGKITEETGFYVVPKYRNGTVSQKLLKLHEQHAKEQGATNVYMCAMDYSVYNYLKRKGYTASEAKMEKRIT